MAIAWLVLTVYLSQQTATDSAATSGWIAHRIYEALSWLGINVSYSAFHALLRKLAHFGVHFVLGWLGYRAMMVSCRQRSSAIAATLMLYCSVAIFDEIIQSLAPGRAPMLFDACINLTGVIIGTIIGIATSKR